MGGGKGGRRRGREEVQGRGQPVVAHGSCRGPGGARAGGREGAPAAGRAPVGLRIPGPHPTERSSARAGAHTHPQVVVHRHPEPLVHRVEHLPARRLRRGQADQQPLPLQRLRVGASGRGAGGARTPPAVRAGSCRRPGPAVDSQWTGAGGAPPGPAGPRGRRLQAPPAPRSCGDRGGRRGRRVGAGARMCSWRAGSRLVGRVDGRQLLASSRIRPRIQARARAPGPRAHAPSSARRRHRAGRHRAAAVDGSRQQAAGARTPRPAPRAAAGTRAPPPCCARWPPLQGGLG